MYEPDKYVVACQEAAGPNPAMALIRAGIALYGAGFGSKSKAAIEAWQSVGTALVALNRYPLAFRGGITRDAEAPIYPGSEGEPATPDMLAVADAMLSPPLAALHGVLDRALDDLRHYKFPVEDFADQAEADAARASAWAEVESVAAWLARLPDPPATEDTADDLTPAHDLPPSR